MAKKWIPFLAILTGVTPFLESAHATRLSSPHCEGIVAPPDMSADTYDTLWTAFKASRDQVIPDEVVEGLAQFRRAHGWNFRDGEVIARRVRQSSVLSPQDRISIQIVDRSQIRQEVRSMQSGYPVLSQVLNDPGNFVTIPNSPQMNPGDHAVSPDKRFLAVIQNHELVLWSLVQNQIIHTQAVESPANAQLEFSADSRHFILKHVSRRDELTRGTTKIFRTSDGTQTGEIPGLIQTLQSPDGTFMIGIRDVRESAFYTYDGAQVAHFTRGEIWWNPNSLPIFADGGNRILAWRYDGELREMRWAVTLD